MSRTWSSTSWIFAVQPGQYHWNLSSVPSSRTRSMTSPMEPASGRCGECGTSPGSSHTSPCRMCTVRGPSSVIRLMCMSPLTW